MRVEKKSVHNLLLFVRSISAIRNVCSVEIIKQFFLTLLGATASVAFAPAAVATPCAIMP